MDLHARRWLAAAAVLSMLTAGCMGDRTPVTPGVAHPNALGSSVTNTGAEILVQQLARGIATAMHSPAVRAAVFNDLRDSPFPEHSIALKPYLRGGGSRLSVATASALNIPAASLSALLDSVPDVQLWMPSFRDRVAWHGDGNYHVFASLAAPADFRAAPVDTAWSPSGQPVERRAGEPLTEAEFVIAPSDLPLEPDAEAKRASAPRQNRATIGTFDEPVGRALRARGAGSKATRMGTLTTCNRDLDPTCWNTGGLSSGYYIDANTTGELCASSANDADNDGLDDGCEYRLANAFRPVLTFSGDEAFSQRQSYWAVRPWVGTVRIFYAIGYKRDGGAPQYFGVTSHPGDSEFIVVVVAYNATDHVWELQNATYSAHYHERYGGDATGTYGGASIGYYYNQPAGAPIAVTSSGKHANYASMSQCMGAWWGYREDCATTAAPNWQDRVEVQPGRNMGESWAWLLDYTTAADGSMGGSEYLWSGSAFCGWTGASCETTAYRSILVDFGF